jgi:hypothetical protein
MMLPILLSPAHSWARGFAGGAQHHAAVFHWQFHPRTRHHHHRRNRDDGYAYWPAGLGYNPLQEIALPALYPITASERCRHTVQVVVVPAESGGERRIRITRC